MRYKDILEKVYELEGLLLLAMSKDEMPEGLEQLIERRLSELMEGEETEKPEQTDSAYIPESAQQPESTEQPELSGDTESAYYALEDEEEEDAPVTKRNPEKPKFRKEGKTTNGEKPVFSLNDRFLFTRELFDGDAPAFNAVINRIAGMESYEKALEYLINEAGINPEGTETEARFLSIIEEYFK